MDFLTILERLGLPIAVLFVLGVGMWRAAVWCGEQVVKPLVAAHIVFLKQVQENVAKVEQHIGTMTDSVVEQTPLLQEINATGKKAVHQAAEHIKQHSDDRSRLIEAHDAIIKQACRFNPPTA